MAIVKWVLRNISFHLHNVKDSFQSKTKHPGTASPNHCPLSGHLQFLLYSIFFPCQINGLIILITNYAPLSSTSGGSPTSVPPLDHKSNLHVHLSLCIFPWSIGLLHVPACPANWPVKTLATASPSHVPWHLAMVIIRSTFLSLINMFK